MPGDCPFHSHHEVNMLFRVFYELQHYRPFWNRIRCRVFGRRAARKPIDCRTWPTNASLHNREPSATWHEIKNGKQKVTTEHMDLPANGMIPLLAENFRKPAAEMKVSYLAGAPKPRVVRLSIKPDGKGSFRIGGARHVANPCGSCCSGGTNATGKN
jgi:hypothetical protein